MWMNVVWAVGTKVFMITEIHCIITKSGGRRNLNWTETAKVLYYQSHYICELKIICNF